MIKRFQTFLNSHAMRAAPVTTLGRAASLAADIATRRDERIIEVEAGRAKFQFLTYPGSGGTGSRGITVLREHYEPLLMLAERYIQPGDTVIDGGANSGIFTCAFGALGARVHAFEPLPSIREHLDRNIALNGLEHRADVVPAAISDTPGEAVMDLGAGAVAASIVRRRGGEEVTVKVESLDHYAQTADLGPVSFIKLDIEGAEGAALRGAKELIARDRPVICLEAWKPEDVAEISEILSPLGYRLAELTFDGEAALPEPFRPIANLLAIPEDKAG